MFFIIIFIMSVLPLHVSLEIFISSLKNFSILPAHLTACLL